MGRKANSKGMLPNGRRKVGQSFVMALHAILDSPDYIALSGSAAKLLWDVARQYNGHNNGDLTVAMSVMAARGWQKKTLARALAELLERDWLRRTRYPRLKQQAGLYALSWLDVDECDGKLDAGVHKEPRRSLRDTRAPPAASISLGSIRPQDPRLLGSKVAQQA